MSLSKIQQLYYSSVTRAAKGHGDCADPDHEAGDLQNILEELLTLIPDNVLVGLVHNKESVSREILNDWLDIEEIEADMNSITENNSSNEIQIAFDVYDASVLQVIRLINPSYDKEKIIEGLESGTLATSTWFYEGDNTFIDVTATGEHIAQVVSQEINDGTYEEFR